MRKNNLLSTRWLIVFGLAALVASTLFATGAFLRTATAVTPRYVDPAGTDAGTCTPIASACLTIGYAISVSAASDTINVAAGTYNEDVLLNKAGLSLIGAGTASTTIDYVGQPGHNNAGMYVQADNVTVQDLTLNDSGAPDSTPRYGLKVGAYDGVTIDGVTVNNSYRTGLDVLGASNITIDGVALTNNGGHGMQLSDVNGASVSNVTISGSGWNDMSVATWGHFSPLGTSGVVISGTNSFGGNPTDNGGLQLEEGNWAFPANPEPISWSTLIADGADVTIQPSDFGYALSGPSDDGQPRSKFYDTLANAQNAAAGSPSHIQPYDRFLRTTNGLAEQTNYYVYDLTGDTMSIQAAIDAAVGGDTINVATGTYTEQVTIGKGVTLVGVGGKPQIDASGQPSGVTITSSDVTLDNFDITGDASTHVGVAVYGSGSDITGTSIVNNNIHGISGSFPAAFYSFGILVNGNTDDISGLVINNNGIDSIGNIGSGVSGAGISLESLSGASLDGNTISNIDGNGISGAGIFLQSPTAAFTVLNNSIDTADIGIVNYSTHGSTDITRGTGAFTNVPVYVVDIPGGTAVDINLQHAMLTGLDPALGALLGLGGPASSAVEVYTPLIQTAIDLASTAGGSTIDVSAGTFTPGAQLVIDKDLTISGASAATTIIKPGFDTGSSGDSRGWFLVNTGITFNLSDVTLDGTGNLVYQAIRQHGEGSITDVIFTEIKYNESGPHYSGVAIAAAGTGSVDVTGSTFEEIGRIGVLYFGPGLSGSIFSGNTYTGKGVGDWLDYALDIDTGAVIAVSNNTITGNRGVASSDGSTSAGILVTTYYGPGTAATITNNTISENTTGIAVGYNATDTSSVTAFNNNLAGNDTGVSSTAPAVDASANWWGTATPAGVAGEVAGPVDYTPWIDDGTDQDLVAKGYQPDLSNLHVDDDSPQTGATGRIQEGIDLVTGSTVNVEAGTYDENVVIDKSITLQAASSPIIDGGASGDVVTIAADGVTVDGFEIRNGYNGITGETSSSIITNNVIHDNLNIPGSAGAGILLWGDNDANEISANTIYNNDRQGVFIGYSDDTKLSTGNTISGNTIYDNGLYTNANGPDASVYGVQLWSADSNTIQNNEIYNHDDASFYVGFPFAQGIYLCASFGNNLTGNSLHDNNYGVGVWGACGGRDTTGAATNTVNYNSIAGNTGYGVRTFDVAVDAEKNWWGDATGADHASNPHGTGQGGDTASDNVDFTPWYATSTTTPSTENVTVTHNPVIAVSDTIQGAIAAALDGDTVAVGAGKYTENVNVNKDVTLVGANPPEGGSAAVVNGTVDLTAGGATVDSLKVVPGSVTGNERAIAVYAGNTSVTGNLIDGMIGDGTGGIVGVGIYGGSKPALLNISVTYNVIKNMDNPLGTPYGGADGIMVQGVVDGVNIIGNTIEDIHSAGWAFGIEVTPTANDTLNPPQNVLVQLNNISLVNDGSVYDVLLDPYAAPYPGVGFSLDETALNAADGDASQVIVKNNFFVALIVGAINKDTAHILNAESNWWGACDGPSGFGPGTGAAVSDDVDFIPWDATKCDKDGDFLTDDEEIFIYGTDPNNPDTDGDGCLDGVEVLPASIAANGGGRDPLNPWDFYDVTGDKYINLFGDILGVILHYSLDVSSPYDPQFDRGPSTGPNPWNMTAPDGSIDLFTDILGVINQFGHDCR